MIRVGLVDDHPTVLASLAAAVNADPDMELIGTAAIGAGPDALRGSGQRHPLDHKRRRVTKPRLAVVSDRSRMNVLAMAADSTVLVSSPARSSEMCH